MNTFVADERATFEARLDLQRDEIAGLLADVDEDAARARLVPSLTTVLGLVKHATFVEQVWFHARLAGRTRAEVGVPDTVEESFALTTDDTVASVRAAYVAACEHSRAVAAGLDLDATVEWHQGPVSLRWIYGHMIAELARHAGHGDILLEQLAAGASSSSEAPGASPGA